MFWRKKKEPSCCKCCMEFKELLEKVFFVINYWPVRGTIQFKKGVLVMANQVSMTVGQLVSVQLVESRADGSVYQPNKGDVTLQVQDSTILSLTDNGDGTGTVTALAAGTSGVAGTDKVTGLTGTGQVTVSPVTPPPPTSATINFGTPA